LGESGRNGRLAGKCDNDFATGLVGMMAAGNLLCNSDDGFTMGSFRSLCASFAASARRVALASALAIPACAGLTVVMYFVPPAVCIGALFAGLIAFVVGADFGVQSKPLLVAGGITMAASVLAAALRGLLG